MIVTINNKEIDIKEFTTVQELIAERAIKRAAVWINGKQLLGAEYETTEPKAGDIIKILRVVAGG